uniref:Uncharacterized LOC109090918 n=2 Tax=Cyprinus carpio TaxID=7962 RepID=A0A8C1IV25_CYPCA
MGVLSTCFTVNIYLGFTMRLFPFSWSLLVTEMTSASHPRFRLLIGWCCLMSSALLIMTVYLAIRTKWEKKSETSDKETNSTAISGNTDQRIGLPPGLSINDYIHLIRDSKEIWICHPCTSSSFTPKNSTVEITVSGLYFFHAQVTFLNPNKASVTLLKNKGPGTQKRILSKVKHDRSGTATMIRLVELKKGDSISLEIEPTNSISRLDSDTYWEIIFFNYK